MSLARFLRPYGVALASFLLLYLSFLFKVSLIGLAEHPLVVEFALFLPNSREKYTVELGLRNVHIEIQAAHTGIPPLFSSGIRTFLFDTMLSTLYTTTVFVNLTLHTILQFIL